MSILKSFFSKEENIQASSELKEFLTDFSIEVMPRTASKIESFREILPKNTRVYVAHIEGVPIEEMVDSAKRISNEGFDVMPHFPARIIKDKKMLEEWIQKYQDEAGIEQALLLAGGVSNPHGVFDSSMQLVETELFEKYNFKNLHFAGHPEGNKDIDHDGTTKNVDEALQWKQDFSERTDIKIAITTQFCFDAGPVINWADSLIESGINIPIHIGVAGPAKLQTLIKFSIACGVGPSLKVLQKRAKDVKKLLLPFDPNDFLEIISYTQKRTPKLQYKQYTFFPSRWD